jgi:hypothetical protein
MTSVDCRHTFCRPCVIKHLETQAHCPECIIPWKGTEFLKHDHALQSIVDAVVPEFSRADKALRQQLDEELGIVGVGATGALASAGLGPVSGKKRKVEVGFGGLMHGREQLLGSGNAATTTTTTTALAAAAAPAADPGPPVEFALVDGGKKDPPVKRHLVRCPAGAPVSVLIKLIRHLDGMEDSARVSLFKGTSQLNPTISLSNIGPSTLTYFKL